MLVGKAGPAALFHFVGQLPHRLLRNRATFSTREGSLRRVNGGQNFRPCALAFLPQGKRFLYCVFLAMKASACNRLANKRFLLLFLEDAVYHTINMGLVSVKQMPQLLRRVIGQRFGRCSRLRMAALIPK